MKFRHRLIKRLQWDLQEDLKKLKKDRERMLKVELPKFLLFFSVLMSGLFFLDSKIYMEWAMRQTFGRMVTINILILLFCYFFTKWGAPKL